MSCCGCRDRRSFTAKSDPTPTLSSPEQKEAVQDSVNVLDVTASSSPAQTWDNLCAEDTPGKFEVLDPHSSGMMMQSGRVLRSRQSLSDSYELDRLTSEVARRDRVTAGSYTARESHTAGTRGKFSPPPTARGSTTGDGWAASSRSVNHARSLSARLDQLQAEAVQERTRGAVEDFTGQGSNHGSGARGPAHSKTSKQGAEGAGFWDDSDWTPGTSAGTTPPDGHSPCHSPPSEQNSPPHLASAEL